MAVLDHDTTFTTQRPGLAVLADQGTRGAVLQGPSYRNRGSRPGEQPINRSAY
ncbi:hypothetical protein GCM10010464_21000 [Pseudonocardia yunnanensis]|uniref:Uncharacterized protein n=1 Tax=Pseudonocardia yunnanensis TaxID=58107 RepID=A0ABW4EPJ9_9PSEU